MDDEHHSVSCIFDSTITAQEKLAVGGT